MNKLPRNSLAIIQRAVATGRVPAYGEPDYDKFFDVWPELCTSISGEWESPGASASRRDVSCFTDIHFALPMGGMLVGVIANQPAVVAVAARVAAALNLESLSAALREVSSHIPKQVLDMDDPTDRLNWYDTPEGAPHVEPLQKLEYAMQDGDIYDELVMSCCRRIVANADEFFEK